MSTTGPTAPTGTVTVLDNGVPVGTAPLDSTGHASVGVPAGLKPGPRSIVARYNGSLTHTPSTSAASTLTVRAAAPTPRPSASHATTAAGTVTPTPATTVHGSRTSSSALAATGPARLNGLITLGGALLAIGIASALSGRRRRHALHRR